MFIADLEAIKRSARIVYDAEGHPVVQIPLAQWQELRADVEATTELPQHERIKGLLKQWENEPDDTPPERWEEFDAFLRENRMNFAPRDLLINDR